MTGIATLRSIARRGGAAADTGQALPPGLDEATSDLNRELAEARASLERELTAQAAAAGIAPPPAQHAAAPGLAGNQEPLIVLREGHKMTFGEQARAAAGHAWRQARRNFRDMRNHPGGLINHLFAQRGPSVDDQIAYKTEKRWVPAGHDDGMADKAGTLYQDLIGIPGVAFFNACKGIVAKPFRFGSAFLAAYLLSALGLILAGSPGAGLAMLIALPVAVLAALIGLEGWVAASRRASRPPLPPEDNDDDDGAGDPAGYYPPSE